MKSRYRKNIKLFYVFTLFDGFIMAYVIERLFYAERGMTIMMVVSLEILYGIIVSILEIPSGILADIWGRKKLLLLAAFLSIFEFIILVYAHEFVLFGLATVVAGISTAAESGSMQAFMYDSLKVEGQESTFEAVYGRFQVFDTIGHIAAALIGGITAYYISYEFNYVVSIGSKSLAFVILCFLVEAPRRSHSESSIILRSFRDYLREGTKFFKNHMVVFIYCMNGMMLGACFNYIDEFWQLLMDAVQVPVILFGGISVLYSIFTIPGNLLASQLKSKISYRTFFQMIPFFYSLGFIVITLLQNYIIILPLVFLGLWHGALEPLLRGYLHHQTDSSIRATVESIVSFILRILTVVVGLIFSLFADDNIFIGFLSLGVICLVYGVINLWVLRRYRTSEI